MASPNKSVGGYDLTAGNAWYNNLLQQATGAYKNNPAWLDNPMAFSALPADALSQVAGSPALQNSALSGTLGYDLAHGQSFGEAVTNLQQPFAGLYPQAQKTAGWGGGIGPVQQAAGYVREGYPGSQQLLQTDVQQLGKERQGQWFNSLLESLALGGLSALPGIGPLAGILSSAAQGNWGGALLGGLGAYVPGAGQFTKPLGLGLEALSGNLPGAIGGAITGYAPGAKPYGIPINLGLNLLLEGKR